MSNLTRWCLRTSYNYGRLIGLINFEIDSKRRRAYISKSSTIYAVLLNVMFFSLLPIQFFFGATLKSLMSKANQLHQYIFLIVALVRGSGVFVTISSRWGQRQELLKLVNAIYQLFVKRPQVERLYRRGVICKFIFATMSELLQISILLTVLSDRLTYATALYLSTTYTITAVLNVVVTQYYFAMLNIHGHYILLIQELRDVLDAISNLNPHRMGGFITKCCSLADQLDGIAEIQSQLQELIKRISRVFGAQYFCMNLTYYMSNIATIYFIVTGMKANIADLIAGSWTIRLLIPILLFYHLDQYITVLVMVYVEDAHAVIVKLLENRTSFDLGLDQRLELAFESFQLQLVRNPLEITCLGLYRVGRRRLLAFGNSLITSSMFLIQYDMANF